MKTSPSPTHAFNLVGDISKRYQETSVAFNPFKLQETFSTSADPHSLLTPCA